MPCIPRKESPTLPGVRDVSDGEAYLRACERDRDAVQALVERHNRSLVAVGRGMGLSDHDARDVAQFAWMRFFEHVNDVAGGEKDPLRQPEAVRGWLLTTTRNAVRDVYRGRRHTIELVERNTSNQDALGVLVVEDAGSDWLEAEETNGQLLAALGQLSESCRELLALLIAEPPLSYEEIAEVLGRPVGSIGPTRQRCIDRLRTLMQAVER